MFHRYRSLAFERTLITLVSAVFSMAVFVSCGPSGFRYIPVQSASKSTFNPNVSTVIPTTQPSTPATQSPTPGVVSVPSPSPTPTTQVAFRCDVMEAFNSLKAIPFITQIMPDLDLFFPQLQAGIVTIPQSCAYLTHLTRTGSNTFLQVCQSFTGGAPVGKCNCTEWLSACGI